LPKIYKAWADLEQDYRRAGGEGMFAEIRTRFWPDQPGTRTVARLRGAVIIAQRWKDDHLDFWLQQPAEAE
jgi:hypothetical protein